jgi:hypothetical protein
MLATALMLSVGTQATAGTPATAEMPKSYEFLRKHKNCYNSKKFVCEKPKNKGIALFLCKTLSTQH